MENHPNLINLRQKETYLNVADLVIIGSGPAGLSAAIYAGRAELNPLVIAGKQPGGQLMNTSVVENYPGFEEGIDGPELMNKMINHAEKYKARLLFENVTEVDFSNDIKFLKTDNESEILARNVVIATGSSPRRLNIENEEKFWGKGVSTCATCDGPLYRGKKVAVIGGGDSAMEEATFLSKFADKVYIVHRRDEFRASKIMQERVFTNDKVEIIWNSEVEEILGDENISAIRLRNNANQSISDIGIDGMFLAIGHTPNTEFLKGQIVLDENGYIISEDGTTTSVEGVFVAGDAQDSKFQQVGTAVGSGIKAGMEVSKYKYSK